MIFPFSSYNRNYRTGLALVAEQSFEQAAERLGEAARLKPDDARTHLQHGLALSEAGRYEEAVSAIEKAMGLDPEKAVFPMFLGVVHLDAQDLESARAMFERASSLDPRNALTRNYAALVMWMEGDMEAAARRWLDIDFIQSCSFEARLLMCVERGFSERRENEPVLNESGLMGEGLYFAAPDPNPWVGLYRKWRINRCRKSATALSARDKHEKAVCRLEEALEFAPRDETLRDALRAAREGWIRELREKRKREGKESGLALEIGCLLWQNGESGKAEPMISAWLEKHLALDEKKRDPFRLAAAYRVLGGIAVATRERESAIRWFNDLKEIDPHDPLVHYLEGRCAVLEPDIPGARHAFERFLAWEPAFGRIRLREWLHVETRAGETDAPPIDVPAIPGEDKD